MRHSPRVTTSVIRCDSRARGRDGRDDRAARSRMPPATPSPSSQPPIPTPMAPAAMNAGADLERHAAGRQERDVGERSAQLADE